MAIFSVLPECKDLTPEIAKLAARSSIDIRALLRRFSEIAKPGNGGPRILLALARLVDQPWVEGRLRAEIAADGDATKIDVFCEHGAGILERLLPSTRLEVPFSEFAQTIEERPEMVLPLRVTDEDAKIILTPLLTTPESADVPVPTFELEEQSLGDAERRTAPPPAGIPAEAAALLEQFVADPAADLPPPTPSPNVHNRPTIPKIEPAPVSTRIDPRREPDD